MAQLLHGNCIEEMKQLDDRSVDLIFCDLPYGQTSCAWDNKIDLQGMWKEFMRIKKFTTPIFFTTTTKFGVELINNAPKDCPFRYDLVWCKSAPCGHLLAKKMPMRKHEMLYVFYERLPLYDISSHKHKFIKECKGRKGKIYEDGEEDVSDSYKYTPPLPTSLIKEEAYVPPQMRKSTRSANSCYGELKYETKNQTYEPPLPNSLLEIKSEKSKHSTQKPVALREWILKYYSKEGDTVLDPTCGSGSTGVACKNMNRNFIGIEMDDEIYETACERVWGDE